MDQLQAFTATEIDHLNSYVDLAVPTNSINHPISTVSERDQNYLKCLDIRLIHSCILSK